MKKVVLLFLILFIACQKVDPDTQMPDNGCNSSENRDECCADQNKDTAHIQCVGKWTYNSEFETCMFVCGSSEHSDYEVSYEDGKLRYKFLIDKPTPCHKAKVTTSVLESFPVQIRVHVALESKADLCAQVITPEEITGEIEVDHKPVNFAADVDGKQLFIKDL